MGDKEDQVLLETFRSAKLNPADPFHWWQLLHELVLIHTDRKAGRSISWTEIEKERLRRQCIRVGRLPPATDSISQICKRLVEKSIRTETATNLSFQVTRFGLT